MSALVPCERLYCAGMFVACCGGIEAHVRGVGSLLFVGVVGDATGCGVVDLWGLVLGRSRFLCVPVCSKEDVSPCSAAGRWFIHV